MRVGGEAVVERHRERFPGARVETDLPGRAPVEAHSAVRIAVEELVENALVHSDREHPAVEVSVTVDPGADAVEVAVADDGPGVPAFERRTFEGETESALEHASGLGLWLVNWIASSSGAEVTCEDNDPRGTVVRIRLSGADTATGEGWRGRSTHSPTDFLSVRFMNK